MTKKGELLWEEKWDETEWPKDWYKGKGNWQIENGTLKAAELPADAHHAYSSRKVTEINAVIQFSFKIDGAKWLGGFFDGKEHVSACPSMRTPSPSRRCPESGPRPRAPRSTPARPS